MYYCNNCGNEFSAPKKIYEPHFFCDTPFEIMYICPHCKSGNFREKIKTHCRCCGAKLTAEREEYCCDACRRKGEQLWKMEFKRKKRGILEPITLIIRDCNRYNKLHGTNYSYGQYVAFIEPKIKNFKRANRRKANASKKEKIS